MEIVDLTNRKNTMGRSLVTVDTRTMTRIVSFLSTAARLLQAVVVILTILGTIPVE
jgi:hypothetical protein